MRIHFANPNFIEPWDYRNVFEKGIGGSETSCVEMAIRLAARGHEVTSYSRLPDDCPDKSFKGVQWKDLSEMDLEEDGLWIIYRRPSLGAECKPTTHRRYWLVCQDVMYQDWKPEAVANFEIVMGLCPRHIQHMISRDPSNTHLYRLSANGVNVERFRRARERVSEGERVPYRLIWTSSPDRGLEELLRIFIRAQEQVPELELHIFYGMDNINILCQGDRTKYPWAPVWKTYEKAINTEGVIWRGRIGQDALADELLKAGLWVYPTWFSETSCIAAMESQVYGCIPITNPIWATAYNVHHGVFIEGPPNESLIAARYAEVVALIANDPCGQARLRQEMMPLALERFDWERVADQWEAWMGVKDIPSGMEMMYART